MGKNMSEPVNEQKKFMVWINRISYLVGWVTLLTSVITGGAMAVVVISGVIARYIVMNPMAWTEEVSKIFMIWTAFLGNSIVTRHREQLGLSFIVRKFPIFLQRVTKFVTDGTVMVFLYYLTVFGIKLFVGGKSQIVPSLGITMYYPLMCVPICGILTMFQLGIVMLIDLSQWGTTQSPFEVDVKKL